MRILLANSLFPDLGIGGSEQSTYYLARGLQQLGHEVWVFSQNVHDETIVEDKDGVHVIRVQTKRGSEPNVYAEPHYQRLAAATQKAYPLDKQLAETLKQFRPDVVNTAVMGRVTSLWSVIKKSGATCVHTLRSYTALCHRRMIIEHDPCLRQCRDCAATRVAGRERSNVVDGVVGISSHILKIHLRSGWFRDTPQRNVIANSYEMAEGVEASQAGFAKPYEFGYIGRLHHTKGVELFLEALATLRAETGRPHPALIAGSGEPGFEWKLRNRYEDEHTRFVGYVTPAEFFEQTRYCVVPSIWFEPFGRIFIESLHHGVPVIGSSRGGGSEIIREGRTGWLFDPTVPSLTDALRRGSEVDAAGYGALRREAMASAEDYSVLAIARQYERFYLAARETAR
ncbi:glycosyltransferase [Methylopila henanensis]|uniref:Glycosyltransferase n=1 Tax=Methylopila henanensis TaxID=873516 RepID=A0ABW4KBH6_9HYPH